jgi:uncharacterized protein (TIGR02246 family)
MDTLERLEAIEAIKQLKARYFRYMDTKDWVAYADLFAPDAVMDMTSEGSDVTTGNAQIAAFVERSVGGVTTVHHGHMPEIEITSPTTATGIWAMEDVLRWPQGDAMATMHGYGHYHETYEKVNGEWRIKTVELRRLRRDFEQERASG